MKILAINPNTSSGFNVSLSETAEKYALRSTTVKVISPDSGPKSIEGVFDEALSILGTIKTFSDLEKDYDGFIIACYSDHLAVSAIREITDKPVVGIAEASINIACSLGGKFSIVTTNDRWKPLLLDAVEKYGVASRCSSVRTTGMRVSELEELDEDKVRRLIEDEIWKAIKEDDAEVICLGCAGMTGFDKELQEKTGIPVLDGFACAVKLLELYDQYGISHSKRKLYSTPSIKELTGLSKDFMSFYGE